MPFTSREAVRFLARLERNTSDDSVWENNFLDFLNEYAPKNDPPSDFFSEAEIANLAELMNRGNPRNKTETTLIAFHFLESLSRKVPIDHTAIQRCYEACGIAHGDIYQQLRDLKDDKKKWQYLEQDQRGFYRLSETGSGRVEEMLGEDLL